MTSRAPAGLLLAAVAASSLVAAATPAAAVGVRTWYAVPHGAGSVCSKVDPCGLDQALADAGTGDTVAIKGGSYGSGAAPLNTGLALSQTGVIVKPASSRAVPVIYTNAGVGLEITPGSTLTGVQMFYTGGGSGIEIDSQTPTVAGALATHLSVFANGDAAACAVGGTLADSLCVNTHDSGAAVGFGPINSTMTAVLRGVTAVDTGAHGVGLDYGVSNGTATISVTNTIARGGTIDVRAASTSGAGDITVNLDYSDYASSQSEGSPGTATVNSLGGNISAAPKFVDPTHGDFTEKAGSPTIDKGAKDPASETDRNGLSRAIGHGTDIGAFERRISPRLTKPVVVAGKKIAKVTLFCNPEGLAGSSIRFKATIIHPPKGLKGKKTLLTKPIALPAVAKLVKVPITLAGLTRHTKYSIVVIAKNPVGKTRSAPIKITTK